MINNVVVLSGKQRRDSGIHIHISILGCVNYKLPLTKSIANDWTTAFAICLCRDWTLCCCSCWPSTSLEGVQGGMRNSVLQGIWWDRYRHCCIYIVVYNIVKTLLLFSRSVMTLWPTMDCNTPAIPLLHISGSLLKLMSISWWCHPTISTSVIPFSACI